MALKSVHEKEETSRERLKKRILKSWIQLMPDFVAIMEIDEAYLLAFLLDKEFLVFTSIKPMPSRHRKLVKERWFYCKMKTLMKEAHLYKQQQSRLFSRLEKRGFITTKRIGIPPLRWIKINLDAIMMEYLKLDKNHPENKKEKIHGK